MAATTVKTTTISTLTAKPIINGKLKNSSELNHEAFDPIKHLNFVEEPSMLSLKDLSLPEDLGISPVAVSQPFPLFSEEAIRLMREEIFTNEVWDNCLHSTDFAQCQLRGHSPKHTPFMYEAWNHPDTLSIVSKIAQVDLIPVIDIEIGNINISVQNPELDQTDIKSKASGDIPVTKWHHDSYPFVCVVMMSDASGMVGGETAVKTGGGEVIKVRGPQIGCGVILQGRVITHQALAAVGGTERITMVTSFRPREASMPDSSVLTTIRPISDLSELYYQWTKYRVEVLLERLRKTQEVLDHRHGANKPTDIAYVKNFLQQQEKWLSATNREIQ